ncbi:MAG: tetratricopeptide repeat protein, partial [Propionivibrio sp.]
MLTRVVRSVARQLIKDRSSLALLADTGVGKTTLAAMLVRMPESLRKQVGRQRLIDASLFLTEGVTPTAVIEALAGQLKLEQGFAKQAAQFAARQNLSFEDRELLEPLRAWMADAAAPREGITVLIDSLDSLAESTRASVFDLLGKIDAVPEVRVVTTARSGTEPQGNQPRKPRDLNRLSKREVCVYLGRAGINPALRGVLIERIAGNWLCAVTFADYVLEQNIEDPVVLADLTLERAFRMRLERLEIGIQRSEDRPNSRTIVFVTLAAAGAGPVLPIELLQSACALQEDGLDSEDAVRQTLEKLGGLTMHSGAHTSEEALGLFHNELVRHVRTDTQFSDQLAAARSAIVQAIQQAGTLNYSTPLGRYAFSHEAEHLAELGRHKEIVSALARLKSPIPRENRDQNQRWYERLETVLGPDHKDVLVTHDNMVAWTGQCGDAGEALRLFQALLPDRMRVRGPDNQSVLAIRSNIAHWTGQCGDAGEALRLFLALLPDHMRVLGPDDPDVLSTRSNIADWTGHCEAPAEALQLLQGLLLDE